MQRSGSILIFDAHAAAPHEKTVPAQRSLVRALHAGAATRVRRLVVLVVGGVRAAILGLERDERVALSDEKK